MGINANVKELIDELADNNIHEAKRWAVAVLANDKAEGNARWRAEVKNRLLNQDTNRFSKEVPPEIRFMVMVEDTDETFMPGRYHLATREAALVSDIKSIQDASARMDALRIKYLNSTLLYGESGTGKTMLGRYVAHELGLPFVYMNFSRLVDSYMGHTSQNISAVFDWVRVSPCVFMLDELDCISLKRSGGSGGPGGEMSRVTITLIQELDRLSNDIVLLAATNRPDRIDDAVLRRFQLRHEVKRFGKVEVDAMAHDYLNDVGLDYDEGSVVEYVLATPEEGCLQSDVVAHINRAIAESFSAVGPVKL